MYAWAEGLEGNDAEKGVGVVEGGVCWMALAVAVVDVDDVVLALVLDAWVGEVSGSG